MLNRPRQTACQEGSWHGIGEGGMGPAVTVPVYG